MIDAIKRVKFWILILPSGGFLLLSGNLVSDGNSIGGMLVNLLSTLLILGTPLLNSWDFTRNSGKVYYKVTGGIILSIHAITLVFTLPLQSKDLYIFLAILICSIGAYTFAYLLFMKLHPRNRDHIELKKSTKKYFLLLIIPVAASIFVPLYFTMVQRGLLKKVNREIEENREDIVEKLILSTEVNYRVESNKFQELISKSFADLPNLELEDEYTNLLNENHWPDALGEELIKNKLDDATFILLPDDMNVEIFPWNSYKAARKYFIREFKVDLKNRTLLKDTIDSNTEVKILEFIYKTASNLSMVKLEDSYYILSRNSVIDPRNNSFWYVIQILEYNEIITPGTVNLGIDYEAFPWKSDDENSVKKDSNLKNFYELTTIHPTLGDQLLYLRVYSDTIDEYDIFNSGKVDFIKRIIFITLLLVLILFIYLETRNGRERGFR